MEKIVEIDMNASVVENVRLVKSVFDANLTKKQLDLILWIISMVNQTDKEFKTYEIPLDTIAKLYNPANPRREETKETVRKSLKSIMNSCFCIMDENMESYYHWIEMCKIDWEKGVVYFKLSKEVKEFYLEIGKRNLTYTLKNIISLRTLTEARLYQWAYSKKGFENDVPISIEDAKLLFYGKKEIETYDFITKYLDPAVKRINEKTDLVLSYEKVRKANSNKNKISSLKFNIQCNYNRIETKPRTQSQIKSDRKRTMELWQERNLLEEEVKSLTTENNHLENKNNQLKDENSKLKKECKRQTKKAETAKTIIKKLHKETSKIEID